MTNAELAILSLVAEQPRHGYEIERVIEERGMREWTEVGFSSIYYLLKKLEQEGLIEGQLEKAARGPARKVYHPTPAGWQALHEGVLEALSVPHRCYSPLQLGLANLPAIPPGEALAALREHRDALAAGLAHVRERWEAQRPLPYFVDAMFEHAVTMGEAESKWIEKLIKQVEEESMSKTDFKKELKHLYNPSKKAFAVVDVPPMQFLMVDGHGDPNTAQEYQDAVEALYAVSYKLKFASKKGLAKDYVVPPLEGLWWAEDPEAFTTRRDKGAWDWTMMIMQPEWITREMFVEAVGQVEKSKGLPALSKLRLETYHEGTAVHIMHVGPYEDEGPTIARMHAFAVEEGYELAGKHHEIYLGDPRKVAPEKLKTVLRQPIRRK